MSQCTRQSAPDKTGGSVKVSNEEQPTTCLGYAIVGSVEDLLA